MIEKITDLWQTWDEKQQTYIAVSAIVLVLALLILLLYAPLKMQNNNLNLQLQSQHNISQKLQYARTKPSNFSVVKPKKAKSVVGKIAKRYGLNVELKLKQQQLILQAKAQEFNALSRFLSAIRNKYAIVATAAVITKTKAKNGFVDVNLTLSLP